MSRLRATFTPIFLDQQVYQRDGNQFRNGPTDGHVNKVVNQNTIRDALDRHLWERLESRDYDLISILPPKKANLNRPGYFDITYAKSNIITRNLLGAISDVVITARLGTHTFDPNEKTKRHFDSSVYITKFFYNCKTRELNDDQHPATDYYSFSISTRSNTEHIDLVKLRHAIASKQIANGSTLPIAELPQENKFEQELLSMAKGPEAITMTLSDDWQVNLKINFFIFLGVFFDSLHAGNSHQRNSRGSRNRCQNGSSHWCYVQNLERSCKRMRGNPKEHHTF